MNKAVLLVCVLALLGVVRCWGNDGHQIVAQIAENYLTQTAYNNMQPYLNGFTLANISTWLDDYKETTQGAWSEDIHFVNLPVNASEFHIQYCELQYTSGVGCAVTSIANYTGILYKQIAKSLTSKCVNESNAGVEPCPLAFVTHLVGDIHQPLHVAFAIDHGGNYVDVDFDNSCTNLHAVWDSRLLFMYEDDTDLDWAGIARVLTQEIAEFPAKAGNWSIALESSIWANDSFQVTRTIPYNFQPGAVSPHSTWVHTPMPVDPSSEKSLAELLQVQPASSSSCSSSYYVLTDNYYYRTIPTVMEQLMKGGVRLATHLNLLFDPEFSPPLAIDPYQAY